MLDKLVPLRSCAVMHLNIKQTTQSAGQKTAYVNQANKAAGQEFYLTVSFSITKQRHAIHQTQQNMEAYHLTPVRQCTSNI